MVLPYPESPSTLSPRARHRRADRHARQPGARRDQAELERHTARLGD